MNVTDNKTLQQKDTYIFLSINRFQEIFKTFVLQRILLKLKDTLGESIYKLYI